MLQSWGQPLTKQFCMNLCPFLWCLQLLGLCFGGSSLSSFVTSMHVFCCNFKWQNDFPPSCCRFLSASLSDLLIIVYCQDCVSDMTIFRIKNLIWVERRKNKRLMTFPFTCNFNSPIYKSYCAIYGYLSEVFWIWNYRNITYCQVYEFVRHHSIFWNKIE